jgi:hypothetical protein
VRIKETRDVIEIVSAIIGLGVTVWLVSTMIPAETKAKMVADLRRPFTQAWLPVRMMRARHSVQSALTFETFLIQQAMTDYDQDRDERKLASTLGVVV